METPGSLLIAVDPGHGGYDNGAHIPGRLEKNDNLRLGLAVQRELLAQGVRVLMTRDTDVFVPLADRARMANEANADLFVSLHRNSYTELTPSANGVENFIYLTALEATAGRAARLVLDQVVKVGVQSDRGVKRGNYYVLRRTRMPAMLLEMGYIINPEDNRLFDENLDAYAAAIAKGVLEYFGLPYRPQGTQTPPVDTPTPPLGTPSLPAQAQQTINNLYRTNLPVDGVFGPATQKAVVEILQTELNAHYNTRLAVDGNFGPATRAALVNIQSGSPGNLPLVVQLLLMLNGYNPGNPDGIYGPRTALAVQMFQRDHYLMPDGIAGPWTVSALIG